jgi:hypothetical protein
VDFSQWPEKVQCSVSFSLGYGEQEKEAMALAQIGKTLESDPMLSSWYTPEQHHYVAQKALEASGRKDVASILLPFNQGKQPPPNPMQQAEIAMKQADAAAKQATAQGVQNNFQLEMEKIQSQERITLAKINLETMKVQSGIQVKQAELAHKIAVDAAEIQLQEEAQAQDKLQAEAQPTR